MSILASLVKAYDRLPDAPPYGFSAEKIGFLVSLNSDGSVAYIIPLGAPTGKKKSQPRLMLVPASFKRSGTTPRPFFLWDNANYALGIGKLIDIKDTRFDAFREKHLDILHGNTDKELSAFVRFLNSWNPELIEKFVPLAEISTAKVIFALESCRHDHFLHEGPLAKQLWIERSDDWREIEGKGTASAVCLITGLTAPIARTHPAIKGIPSKGGKDADSLVSFNLDAFTSYGHEQGDNAPVSEAAAFAYTTVLNRFLERDSRHRVQIGDASTVFWADSSDAEAAQEAESLFAQFSSVADDEAADTDTIGDHLRRIREGQLLEDIEPKLAEGVRFHVLGLAPNAARLSIRFHYEDDFGTLTRNYQRYLADMRIVPPPRKPYAGLWLYLSELAVQRKRENVPPNLAGEWMRAILTGAHYPLTLLSTTLMRIRADGDINAYRVSMLRAVLVRNFNKKEAPVALDPIHPNRGYLLGRLFAVYEQIQRAALGKNVNATIKDKFYGSASAQPRNVFPLLDSGAANHLSKIGKQESYKLKSYYERKLGEIINLMEPGDNPFPVSLSTEDQTLFVIGYFHQRFTKKNDSVESEEVAQ